MVDKKEQNDQRMELAKELRYQEIKRLQQRFKDNEKETTKRKSEYEKEKEEYEEKRKEYKKYKEALR